MSSRAAWSWRRVGRPRRIPPSPVFACRPQFFASGLSSDGPQSRAFCRPKRHFQGARSMRLGCASTAATPSPASTRSPPAHPRWSRPRCAPRLLCFAACLSVDALPRSCCAPHPTALTACHHAWSVLQLILLRCCCCRAGAAHPAGGTPLHAPHPPNPTCAATCTPHPTGTSPWPGCAPQPAHAAFAAACSP